MLKTERLLLLQALFLMCISNLTFAQGVTTAAMNGRVTDTDNQPLAGATILAIDVASGTRFGTTSRSDGKYNIQNMKVGGPYTIRISFVGYAGQSAEGINLSLGQNLELNFQLSENTLKMSELTVSGKKNSILNSGRTGASTNVDLSQITAFPTISRSFQDFQKFTPQFSGSANVERGNSAAGRNNKYNNIQIDGTQYNDLFGLGQSGAPGGQAGSNPISLDAIQEFQVVIAPFDVRYGGFTGGGINAITRSGSNNYHGSLYYYGRNENFMGKSPDNAKKKYDEFSEYQSGFRAGGPIVKDKLFFFVSGEMTQRKSPASQLSITQGSVNNADSLAYRFSRILMSKYGYDPGSYSGTTLERPSSKIFARLDYNLAANHKLTLRHNLVDAHDDITGASITNLVFSNRNYKFNSQTNSTVLQLTSTFGNTMSNELTLGYTAIRDKREVPGKLFPQIDIKQFSNLVLSAGTEQFSGANSLDQDVFEFTDNFSFYTGDHVFTVGTHNEFFSFSNLFIRNYYGYYSFNSLNDFEAEKVASYEHSYSATGNSKPAAEFSAIQYGIYLQDEWRVMPNLKVTLGLRLDIPTFPDTPARNDSVAKYFGYLGYGTDIAPKTSPLFSPRVGFNYDPFKDRSTIIRGGVGIFTGRIPYVWISNQYGNTGVMLYEASGGAGTQFVTDVNNLLVAGQGGVSANRKAEINLSDPELKMPQVLRYNLGIDQKLPFDFLGTVEFLYSKSINDMIYQDINIGNPTGTTDGGRPVYGKPVSSANFTRAMIIKNTSRGYQYNFTLQLQRLASDGFYTNMGYTYGRAFDQNSVASSQARSQFRYNPIDGNPNDPDLARSSFEVRHRVFAAVSYTASFMKDWNTTVSLYFNSQSGRPFSYTYLGDVNKDGHDANDLIYIPKDRNDIYLGTIDKTTKAYVRASEENYDALERYINRDEYLKNHRGQIAERNSNVEPWVNQMDLKLTQEIPLFQGHKFEVTFDVLNVLNLINSDWGWVRTVNFSDNLLKLEGSAKVNAGTADEKTVNVFSFKDKSDPYQKDNLLSRYQMQFGVRYSF